MSFSDLLQIDPYISDHTEKSKILNKLLFDLTIHHYNNCEEYKKILDAVSFDINLQDNYNKIPFLPVRLFKMLSLKSIRNDEIVKTMTSSGTSGQVVSKIFLDNETSANQTKTLTKIVSSFIGNKRVPMIIIDSESVVKDRNLLSARGAGILGFSLFGSKRIFALDDKMDLNIDLIESFLQEYKDQKILLFGFTFMIWEFFFKALLRKGIKLDLSKTILIHGGGWKKLVSEAVSSETFKEKLNEQTGITNVHDYYGMVEQTGSIYLECECGYLHAPLFADIIIRRPIDFSEASYGEKGIIQVLSILPKSYPGHSLLTEDEGILFGEDDCACGRKGKYFKIIGRLKNAEIRGCSDTYESRN